MGTLLGFIIWLLIGALIGWLASIVMKTDAQQGPLLNIIVGIVGALIGGFVFQFLGIGGSNINSDSFSLWSLFVSFVGALILLAIVNLVRRGSVR
ncbi:MAG: GlsB/YeaQ/YmgE family stress response membrane protein [Chloroflexi bacterium AL-W]|nr:GlsB/YeaQ/YmgE family stress response membrane protein [Chloroflexi bacterium AL-N1]NOK68074.1 GlsB/YeaQ/YmgE family stress response membrane protein [Chloroflexi bacterium AL-N10]NOK73414.1 GlsB/YeaQ/YmgE family stress response membrane protein [Chloroflexi bacterium AL-N5]NOK83328.1 GlsB/YeaQ/YmgE family stress response membrane protein [Chloroflexi bacterium AL-W]NOK87745.1 GlsB/YeaQ/YmgE family stress response membrane protein [Chloroflexi bacterium AL-N15]